MKSIYSKLIFGFFVTIVASFSVAGVVSLKSNNEQIKETVIEDLISTREYVSKVLSNEGVQNKDEIIELYADSSELTITYYSPESGLFCYGDRQYCPSLQEIIKKSEEKTANNKSLNLQIAINYGGRAEIVNAIKQIAKDIASNKISSDDISEDLVSKYLYTNYIPDPDLIIRTGGEYRISNYLLWQIAYSEFYITKMLWPDFDKEALRLAISDFAKRNRRFGRD